MLPAGEVDLGASLEGGQAFHWTRVGDVWWGALGDTCVGVRATGEGRVEVWPGATADRMAAYLGLDDDLGQVHARILGRGRRPGDQMLARAVGRFPGLRILRQPRWECLATFVTSSMKRVAHIRRMGLEMRGRFGRHLGVDGGGLPVHAFPHPPALASAGEDALRACGLGYRAAYLAALARMVADGQADLDGWAALPTPAVRDRLLALPGVGPKIADCVLLFAFGRHEAFPVDVWVARVMRAAYFDGEKVPERRIVDFARRRFGAYAGYAQQYLFHDARLNGLDEVGKNKND